MVIEKNKSKPLVIAKNLYISILLVIFGGIVLHAPISVGFGTLWPDYSLLIKSWKEILMLIAGLLALFLMYKNKKLEILRDPTIFAIAIYGLLHLLLMFYKFQGLIPSMAGLAIDLRYVLFFGLVYIAMKLYPEYRRTFIKVGITGAIVVLVFALLQVYVLPCDVLKYIGYSIDTISPYLTIDKNYDFIRINSTLRGPNPLGAYSVIVMSLGFAAIIKNKLITNKITLLILGIMFIGGMTVLWFSYSRSALIAAIVAISLIVSIALFKKLSIRKWLIAGLLGFIATVAIVSSINSPFVSNILLHENPVEGNNINSNEGHLASLVDGVDRLAVQPFGAGIGSTGSASLMGEKSVIIENQYLFIAHEAGWLGLIIFMYTFMFIQVRLWKLRNNWLALGVFASGVGLFLIGIILPVWVDDTVSIIWWGLAGLAIGSLNIASGELPVANSNIPIDSSKVGRKR